MLSTWTQDGTATYDPASGTYKATSSPLTKNTIFQLRFAGDSSYKTATSPNVDVKVSSASPPPGTGIVIKKKKKKH